MKVGNLVRVYAPQDRYTNSEGKVKRSIILWDNEYLSYKNGKIPTRSITRDDILLVLRKKVASTRMYGKAGSFSPSVVRNQMIQVITSCGEIGWVLQENLEVIQ